MNILDIAQSQLLDPVRIGLLIALIVTTRQTSGHTGHVFPLALGALFVAVLIPTVMSASAAVDTTTAVAVGVLVNAAILAVLFGALALWQRMSTRREP